METPESGDLRGWRLQRVKLPSGDSREWRLQRVKTPERLQRVRTSESEDPESDDSMAGLHVVTPQGLLTNVPGAVMDDVPNSSRTHVRGLHYSYPGWIK